LKAKNEHKLIEDIASKLAASGFFLNAESGVWKSRDFKQIPYSDGDEVENRILDVVKTSPDVSTLSDYLRPFCTDWASTYHLSQLRSNLLRPFEQTLKSDVLELGAGCGAITRYLGETANSVVAVEGSWRRCEINVARMRGLGNVKVVASEISDFKPDILFDTVVIVGVLEYSGLFIKSSQPHLDFLRQAKSLLKPGGKMLLAIENKLGLKYFAGAPEDHVSVPMYGIENRYEHDGVMTFSKTELMSLLQQAGFVSNFFHSPLPDYKLTRSVVSEKGMKYPGSIAKELFQQAAYTDRQLPESLNFDLWRAWETVDRAGLLDEFSNSFIVESSITPTDTVLGQAHAHYYGAQRVSEFTLERVFLESDSPNNIRVKTSLLKNSPENESAYLKHRAVDEEEFFMGRSLSDVFIYLVSVRDWDPSEFLTFIDLYIDCCKRWCIKNGLDWPHRFDADHQLPGTVLDLIPRNMKVDDQGNVGVFDLEWGIREPLEMGFLMFRAVLDITSLFSFTGELWRGSTRSSSRLDLLTMVMDRFSIDHSKIDNYIMIEVRIQRQVAGGALSSADYANFLKEPLKPVRASDALKSEHSRGESRETTLEELVQRKLHTQEQLNATQEQLNATTRTLSWRVTKPLRLIRSIFR